MTTVLISAIPRLKSRSAVRYQSNRERAEKKAAIL
jgi:hypothetical protein